MRAKNYATFFECIDKLTPIEDYEKFIYKECFFKDPFHEVKGLNKIFEIFQMMYKNLDSPTFKIDEVIEDKNIAYFKWSFHFKFKNEKKPHSFQGLSRVVFNSENKVISHEDYWDAAENIYEKLPIISTFIKYIKNKIKAR